MNKLLAIAALVGWLQLLPNDVTVSAVALLAVTRFLQNVDRRPAVLEIGALIAVLQFILAALVMYRMGNSHLKYHMYVDEATYFSYAIPATCCLLLGLFVQLSGKTVKFRKPIPQTMLNSLGVGLVLLGFFCAVTVMYVPVQLRFVFYLLAQLRYVGVLYLYFNESTVRWPAAGLVFLSLLVDTARSGMFHELILWGTLLSSFYFLARPPSMKLKVLFLAATFCAVAMIQLVKYEYRQSLRKGKDVSLAAILINSLGEDNAFGEVWQESMVVRINQGWIVSAAMDHVPSLRQFAYGETIKEAIIAAVLPRILVSDKRTASGSENTREYTGLDINEVTSMGLSPLGEAYVNFGGLGGCGVMLCFGLMLNAVYHWLVRLGYTDQYFLFVIPLVFLQAIKMETEFLTVFNHLTKSCFLIIVLYYAFICDKRTRKHVRRQHVRKTVHSRRPARLSRAASVRGTVR